LDNQYNAADSALMPRKQKFNKEHSLKRESWEWLKASLIAAIIVVLIRLFLFSPFIVEGISMEPTLDTGERLIVNKMVYRLRQPERDEVIVFHAPEGKDYIKRVIAVAGDRVKVENDQLFINGIEVEESYLVESERLAKNEGRSYNILNFAEDTVPENSVFVMGDNRSNSKDSRSKDVTYIPVDKIIGRAEFIFWPIPKIEFIHAK
jgi:signal peptidase I